MADTNPPAPMVMHPFVHLRVHTHLSLMRATCQPEDIVAKAKEYKMPAVAKTEFGSLHGAPTFVKHCLDAGIKPILGTEFKVEYAPDLRWAVTFIALDRTGYKNLVHMNTVAWCQRKQKKDPEPHVKLEDILGQGMVALVENNNATPGFKFVLQQLMTKVQTCVEVTQCGHPDDANCIAVSRQVAAELQLPIVLTNNVLWTNQDGAQAYEIALKINKSVSLIGQNTEHHFRSPQEMSSLALDPEWYANTIRIADQVQDYGLINKEFVVPTFKDKCGEWTLEQSHARLEMDCWTGLAAKGLVDKPEYVERLQYELSVMRSKKFSPYFLIIAEVINYMKSVGMLPPVGRGSSVGSLVCYALDIIARDPIEWAVPFERFINSGRKDLPDIDTDITQDGRGQILRHIADVHGHDRVAQIATYQTMGLKAAIDNVGRALGVPHALNRDVRSHIPEDADDIATLPDDVKKDLTEVAGWSEYATQLCGAARNLGYHAAGIVISNTPLGDLVPLLPEEDGVAGIQYDMRDVEILGLLKLDMLGLKTLDVIQHTLQRVKARHGADIDIYHLSPNNLDTYKLISSGDFVSVFQLDSPGYRKLCRQLQPENFHQMMALNALYRPGPLESGVTSSYVERRHGREQAVSWHPWLDNILRPTFQTVLFQEQAMNMSRILAGFSDVEADEFRKGIGKKNEEAVQKSLKKFAEKAVKMPNLTPPPGYTGTLEQWVGELVQKLYGYARYMWNIGHSCGYGWITYITAYLESHYPQEYYASLLDGADKPDKITALMRGIMQRGLTITPPNINESELSYTVGSDGGIYMGLASIRSVGEAAKAIIEERNKNGKFTSFIEFCQRLPSVNSTVKSNLIKAGLFSWDKMMCDRDKLENLAGMHKIIRKKNKKFDGTKVAPVQIAMECSIMGNEFTELERQRNEREVLHSFVTGHPAAVYQRLAPYLERRDTYIICPSMIQHCQEGENVLVVGMVDAVKQRFIQKEGKNHGKPYLMVNISDNEANVLVNIWSPMCEDYVKILVAGQVGLFECTVREDRYREGALTLQIRSAIMLTHGLPIQGVFTEVQDPAKVVEKIGGLVDNVLLVGRRRYSSIRGGRVVVAPDVLETTVSELGQDIHFMVSMDAVQSST